MAVGAHHQTGETVNALNYAIGYWDSIRHRRKHVEPRTFAAMVGTAVLVRYPELNSVAASYDPPLTGLQLAEQIANEAFPSSQPNYWSDQTA